MNAHLVSPELHRGGRQDPGDLLSGPDIQDRLGTCSRTCRLRGVLRIVRAGVTAGTAGVRIPGERGNVRIREKFGCQGKDEPLRSILTADLRSVRVIGYHKRGSFKTA